MNKYITLGLIVLLWGCKPENITIDKVISPITVSNKTPLADGTTLVTITAQINGQADADKQSVIFEASAGKFVNSTNDTLVTQAASFKNGLLTASVQLRVPITTGKIYILARPVTTSPDGDFTVRDTITTLASLPATLTLTPGTVFVKNGFGGEVLVTALLKNSFNNSVSTGAKVIFEDYYANGKPVNGVFRALKDTTDATSTASTSYSPGYVGPMNSFYLKCTYLDKTGNKTNLKDSCLINVIP